MLVTEVFWQVATQFKTSLSSLIDILMSKEPSYIRCIKPNGDKEAGMETSGLERGGGAARLPPVDSLFCLGPKALLRATQRNQNLWSLKPKEVLENQRLPVSGHKEVANGCGESSPLELFCSKMFGAFRQ